MPKVRAAVLAFLACVGCSRPAFEIPDGRCEEPRSCHGALPRLRALPAHPRHSREPWAVDGVQGVAHDSSHWYIASTQRIWKVPLTENLTGAKARGVEPFGGRFRHIGDIDFYEGYLFLPLEQDRHGGPRSIGVLTADLEPVGLQPLDGARFVPWCAVHPVTGRLYTSGFDADRIQVFRVELAAGHFALAFERDLRLRYSPEADPRGGLKGRVSDIQGGVISPSGKLYLSTNHPGTGIVVFDADSGVWLGRIPVPFESHFTLFMDEEVQGIDLFDADGARVPGTGGQIHLLLHDVLPRSAYWMKHWSVVDRNELSLL